MTIIPKPRLFILEDGIFYLTADTQIIAGSSLNASAEFLASRLRAATGFSIPVCDGEPSQGAIVLRRDTAIPHNEGYRMSIATTEAEIVGASDTGIFWGIQSFLQLLDPSPFSSVRKDGVKWTLPIVRVEDEPRFIWRDLMLDTGRYFMPVDFIKRLLDVMALYKLNVFHWHLTEDQGWRLEIKKYPRLTEIGAWRDQTLVGHLHDEPKRYDGVVHGGFYTQSDVREIVAYAAERQIMVVPEIDMPGHMQAAIAAYPELGNLAIPVAVAQKWGVSEHVLNVREETILFMQDILDEVLALFPAPYIHIGGDECPKTEWRKSEEMQARLGELGLADEDELQSYFIRRITKYLHDHGRKPIGWDEILEGGLAPEATVMSWRGVAGGVAAAKAGHDVIITPQEGVYLDYYQSENTDREPLALGGRVTLEDIYGFDPIPKALAPSEAAHVLGTGAKLWTEYVSTPEHAEYMLLPRLCALAEVAWSRPEQRDYAEFIERLNSHRRHLAALGLNFRDWTD